MRTSRSSRSCPIPPRPASCARSGRPGCVAPTTPRARSSTSSPGPTTGGVILAFETARQLGLRSIFAEEVRDADGGTRREFRRGLRDPARRARPPGRRHPHDRRLAAGHDPGRGGDGRRDRRVRRARGSQRWTRDPDVTRRRAGRIRCGRSGSSTCRPTNRARPRAPAVQPASPSTRRAAPGPRHPSAPDPGWIDGRGTCSPWSWSSSSRSRVAPRSC